MAVQIIPFSFENHSVRTVIINDQPWFVAADVCAALDLGNVTMALRRLDADEQALNIIEGLSRGNETANIINESGLYSLVLRSRKPEAKRFKKWVTSEVLPTIRKTGSYDARISLNKDQSHFLKHIDIIEARAKRGEDVGMIFALISPDRRLSFGWLGCAKDDVQLSYFAASRLADHLLRIET